MATGNFFWCCLWCLVSLYAFVISFYYEVMFVLKLYMWKHFEAWDVFSPEQIGICFCRYSPGSLRQIYSFVLCVFHSGTMIHSGSVNSCCHCVRRQVYQYMFSRGNIFSLLLKRKMTMQEFFLKSFVVD